jgi:predicted Zn-dependent peptidase
VPSAATLVASGDISASEIQQLAGEALGTWAAVPRDASIFDSPALLDPPAPAAPRVAIAEKPGAPQSELRMGHVGLSRKTPDYHALLVVNMVLGGQFVSRVNMKLRQEKGYTYGARTAFDFRRGRGPFLLSASIQNEGAGDAVREAAAEIEAIGRHRPPTVDEVQAARAALTRGYARNFETAEQLARAMAQLVLYGLPDDYFDTFASRVNEVDVEHARMAASTHLRPDALTTTIVGDVETIQPQLVAAGLGNPIRMAVTF